MNDDEYFTVGETAAKLKISEHHVRRLIKSGDLNAHRVGKSEHSPLRISRTEIDSYMARNSTSRG